MIFALKLFFEGIFNHYSLQASIFVFKLIKQLLGVLDEIVALLNKAVFSFVRSIDHKFVISVMTDLANSQLANSHTSHNPE